MVGASYRAIRNGICRSIRGCTGDGVLIKLLAVTAIVPIALLVLARLWQIRHETRALIWDKLSPLAIATIVAPFVTFVILAPYLHSLNPLTDQVIKFHLAAKKMMISSEGENVRILGWFFTDHIALSAAATLVSLLRLLVAIGV